MPVVTRGRGKDASSGRMLTGRLLAESLRPGYELLIADLRVVRLGRHDVTASTIPGADPDGGGATASQPSIWTFVDFEAPDERAAELAQALADGLLTDDGWWADFKVGDDRVIVFAGKVFQ
jgi:hypothetical protein